MKQAWRRTAAATSPEPPEPTRPTADPTAPERLRLSRVVKKLLPSQPGTMRLTRRYGEALVCVRYRQDPTRTYRYTTIELVVDAAPVHRPLDDEEPVYVRIGRGEADRQRSARSHGAKWDSLARLWRMPRKTARLLGLSKRIVTK